MRQDSTDPASTYPAVIPARCAISAAWVRSLTSSLIAKYVYNVSPGTGLQQRAPGDNLAIVQPFPRAGCGVWSLRCNNQNNHLNAVSSTNVTTKIVYVHTEALGSPVA